jgi:hypothetical protein
MGDEGREEKSNEIGEAVLKSIGEPGSGSVDGFFVS